MDRLKTKSRLSDDADTATHSEPDTANIIGRPALPKRSSRQPVNEIATRRVYAGKENDARTLDRAAPEQLFLRLPQVLKAVGVGRSTVWRWCKEGLFPTPVRLGPRVVAWRASDVSDWAAARTSGQDSAWRGP